MKNIRFLAGTEGAWALPSYSDDCMTLLINSAFVPDTVHPFARKMTLSCFTVKFSIVVSFARILPVVGFEEEGIPLCSDSNDGCWWWCLVMLVNDSSSSSSSRTAYKKMTIQQYDNATMLLVSGADLQRVDNKMTLLLRRDCWLAKRWQWYY